MADKKKIVEINGQKYQIGKLSACDGSFIVMKVLATAFDAMSKAVTGQPSELVAQTPALEVSNESKARALTAKFMFACDYELHKMIQVKTLSCVSKIETPDGGLQMITPIITPYGQWVGTEIKDNAALVVRLETEALVFSISDFLDSGGLSA